MRLHDLHAIALDHRIRQHLVGHFGRERARLILRRGGHLELEELPLAHVDDAAVAERLQRLRDCSSLRVEDGRFQRDVNPSSHDPPRMPDPEDPAYTATGTPTKTRANTLSTLRSWSFRSNALSISARESTFVTSASARSRSLKSRFSWNDRIAFRCTHSYACSREMPRRASSSSTVPEKTTPRDRSRFSFIRSGYTTMPRAIRVKRRSM